MRDAAGAYALRGTPDRRSGRPFRDPFVIPSRRLGSRAFPRTSLRDSPRSREKSQLSNRPLESAPIFPSCDAFNWIEIDTVVFECQRVPLESRPGRCRSYLARVKIARCRSVRLFSRDNPIGCRDYRASRGNFPRILDWWKNSDGYSQRRRTRFRKRRPPPLLPGGPTAIFSPTIHEHRIREAIPDPRWTPMDTGDRR